jgi:hypothetical protein
MEQISFEILLQMKPPRVLSRVSFTRRAFCLPRERFVRSRRAWFTLERRFTAARPFGGHDFLLAAVAAAAVAGCRFARFLSHAAFLWWRQVHAGPPGLGKSYGNGLLG